MTVPTFRSKTARKRLWRKYGIPHKNPRHGEPLFGESRITYIDEEGAIIAHYVTNDRHCPTCGEIAYIISRPSLDTKNINGEIYYHRTRLTSCGCVNSLYKWWQQPVIRSDRKPPAKEYTQQSQSWPTNLDNKDPAVTAGIGDAAGGDSEIHSTKNINA